MPGICFDTSIFITFRPDPDLKGHYLSAVVVQELLAGATDSATVKALKHAYNLFKKSDRLLVPIDEDWWETGKILNHLWRAQRINNKGLIPKQPKDSVNRLVRDVLIARTVRRVGATLITENIKDFELIKQVCPVKVQSGRRYFWEQSDFETTQ